MEGSDVTKLDLNGTVHATYHFERLIIHDVAITQDQARMVCVGTMTASMDGLHPSKCRAEKQILGAQQCQGSGNGLISNRKQYTTWKQKRLRSEQLPNS